MTISMDEATRLGWTLDAYLNGPDVGGDGQPQTVLHLAEYLKSAGLLSEVSLAALRDFVYGKTTEAHKEADDLLGGILLAVARYHPNEGVIDALGSVARAAVDGNIHAGPQAARALASVAAVDALTAAPAAVAFAHKE